MQLNDREGPAILGMIPEQKLAALVERLGGHLAMAHTDAWSYLQQLTLEAAAFGVLAQFQLSDQAANERRGQSAAMLQQMVRRVLSDEDIERLVRKHFGADALVPKISGFVRDMRDWLWYSDVLTVKREPGSETASV